MPLCKGKPVIDGKLDDAFWKKAGQLSDFVPVIGGFGECSPVTKVYIGTDKDTLYLGFRCYENDLNGLKNPKRKRDSGGTWDDDTLELFFITAKDPNLPYHQFCINAAGSIDDFYGRNFIWDAKNIKAVPGKEEKAWILEVAIPLSDFNYPVGKNAPCWRLNIMRTRTMHRGDRKTNGVRKIDTTGKWYYEETGWSPPERLNYHVPYQFGYAFLEVCGASKPSDKEDKK